MKTGAHLRAILVTTLLLAANLVATAQKPELVVQTGHSNSVLSVAFSPDGKILASGSDGGIIKLLDVESGIELRTLKKKHSNSVLSVAFSPDGRTLASAGASESEGSTIKLWNIFSGEEIKTLDVITTSAISIAFSPNGKIIASGCENGMIKIWDIRSGKEIKTLKGHTSNVWSIIISSDSKKLESVSLDKTIKEWDIATGQQLKSIESPFPDYVQGSISLNGKIIALFSGAGMSLTNPEIFDNKLGAISLIDVTTGQMRTLTGHVSLVRSVAFSPNGKTIASGSDDYTVKLWNVETGKELKTLGGYVPEIEWISVSPDRKTIALIYDDYNVRFWYFAQDKVMRFVKTNKRRDQMFSITEIIPWAESEDNDLFDPEDDEVNLNERVFIKADGNKKLNLFEANTRKLLASLIAINESDWVVVDHEGRFDASPNAEKSLHYVVSSKENGYEVINLEQLKWRYYEPGLLRKIFKGEPLRDVAPFNNVELYPKVEEIKQAQTDASTKRTIKLTNRGGGIGRVQVFVNGSEFIEDARDEKLKQNPNIREAVITFDLKGANERIVAGQETKVEIIAWNYDAKTKEGYISSRGTRIAYVPQDAAPVAKPELYAIIGGVSDYEGDALDLRFAAKDAEDFYKAIEVGGKNLFGVEKVHLKLLATGDNPKAIAPTKANFKKAFEEFAKQAKATDVLLVYLAGHGVTLGRGTDTYLYLTKDANTTDTSKLSDTALREQVSINSEELTEWHKSVLAQKQVLILDTCAAGAAAAKLVEKRDISSDAIRAIDRMQWRRGFHVLMGSAADAVSYEASQYGQGLLTYALLQGINSGEALQDGQIDVAKLFNFAADNVPRLANNIGGIQRPEIRVPYGGASFAVGFIRNEQDKSQIPLAQVKPLILRPVLQNQKLGYDNLKLTAMLRDALREASFITTRGTSNTQMVFVDADEMPDALTPAGNYTIESDTVKITLNLILNNQPVATFEVMGDKNHLSDLISKLLKKLTGTGVNKTKSK